MIIIFCADPLDPKQVDSVYQSEANAVHSLSVNHHLIDFEALLAGFPQQAINRVPAHEAVQDAVYRGWMLKPNQYQQLYEALLERGIRLINDPSMYKYTHYLPESYAVIENLTPHSVWLPINDAFTMDAVYNALKVFGDKPVIVKDYVKSQKHYWNEACYIPSAEDRLAVERVVQRFLELQGDDLNEGLVFREFIEFEPLMQHPRSGMPLTKEFRVFVMDGDPVYITKYWSEGDYHDVLPEIDVFLNTARQVKSRFFTMDIAQRTDGEWMIVELGDGQVAGLPDHVNAEEFYRAVLKGLKE
jgi:ATP-grasp domain-containing protein